MPPASPPTITIRGGNASGVVAPAAPFDVRVNQYEIIRPLGRGGMGEVALARDLRLGRLVAIKVLTTRKPDSEERFLDEARATARCRHDNIVVIYEVGTYAGQPFMVLEYIEGQTLRQWLRDHAATSGPPARVPYARAVDLMLPVVRALAHAHEQGIIHRDLKPENIMLARTGSIKVLDFGIAKWVEPALPEPGPAGEGARPEPDRGSLAGTRPYMAPEQLALGEVDPRADVWAVGAILFELVTGAPPALDDGAAPDPHAATTDEGIAMPGAGEHVPGPGPLGSIIDRCLVKDPAHRMPSARVLLAELEAIASGARATAVALDDNPFAGLAAFQEVDAGRFFGRDRDIERVITEMRRRPLVAVVGPSGIGKSSLVRAGVLPALRRSGWDARVVRPGRAPLAALAAIALEGGASAAATDSPDPAALAQLRAEPGTLGARLRAHAADQHRRIVLFVDQLEELYALGAPPAERAAFLACLAAVADDPTSPLRVLVSIRSDFLDRLAEERGIGVDLTGGLVLLSPMDRESMRDALRRPVEASAHRFEPPALVERMIDAVAGTRGALPLLQFTAARLWERRDRERRLLTETSYEQLDGVGGALATHADAVLAGMAAAQQVLARAVFERLITPERTRALVGVDELRALHRDRALVDDLIHQLAVMRLVVVERGVEGAEPIVELVHESLIERWPTLVHWLAENQGSAAMLARLRTAAKEWERGGHAAGLLWTGEIARAARTWRQRYRGELSPVEQRYLAAVQAAAERARRVRRRLFGGILAAAVFTAIGMGWLAWNQTEARRRAADEAERSRDATRMAALRALSDDPTTQLALLREIEDVRAPPPGATQEAKRLLHAGIASVVLMTPYDVYSAAFSPDGLRIVSASDDKTVRVWNADGSGEPLILRGHEGAVRSVAFSPDGRYIVSASTDQTLRVWRADGGGEPRVLRGHSDWIYAAVWSPDGRRIASAARDKTVRIWNADGSGAPLVLRGHDRWVQSVAWSPDGKRVASGAADSTIRIWNADGSGAPLVLRRNGPTGHSVAFSPDGRRIVSASDDRTVQVWSADGSGEPLILLGHDGAVNSAAFSPDGQRIVSASYDKTVRVWNADGTGEPLVLRGHDGVLMQAAFSPDGQRIVSASYDKTVRVWNLEAPREPVVMRVPDGQGVWPASPAFSPDGQRIASASFDLAVRVWNADGRTQPLVLRGHGGVVWSAEFSPDGQRIASASEDTTVRVWSADGRGEPLVLRGHGDRVNSAAFSPDGRSIVSASEDKTVRVWSADGRGEPLVLRGHDRTVWSAGFSPDGQRIVSASRDKTVRVWSADGRGEPLVLRGHGDSVASAAFSPDGRRIVSASADRTVRVWSADGRGEPLVLRGHESGVDSAAFSPDGRYIVSASRDRTIRVWRSDGSGEPIVLIGHDSEVLGARFSPDGLAIASVSLDHTVRVWHDLAATTLDDPRLWTATAYCPPVERRVKLLGVTEDQAARDRDRCLERIALARIRDRR